MTKTRKRAGLQHDAFGDERVPRLLSFVLSSFRAFVIELDCGFAALEDVYSIALEPNVIKALEQLLVLLLAIAAGPIAIVATWRARGMLIEPG